MSETEATTPGAEEDVVLDASDETGVADEAHAHGDDHQDDGEGALEGQPDDDETEEIEREGKRYRIPKALKGELLMQADYTRKTQEVAEERRALATTRAEQEASLAELRTEIGRVAMLETSLKAYDNVDWQTLRAQDPDSYRFHYDQFRELKDQLKDATETLSAKERARSQDEQAKTAQALRETAQVLARDIPGFDAKIAGQILDYGVKQAGMTREEAQNLADPRIWKLLHRAMTAEAKLQGVEKKRTVTQRAEVVQQVKPAASVRGSAPSTGLSDNLSAEEWTRRRNAQLAKRRG